MSNLSEFERRIMEFDRRARLAEAGDSAPRGPRTLQQQNEAEKARLRAEAEKLGVGKARQRRQAEKAALTQQQFETQASQLMEAALDAYNDWDEWVDGEPDEYGAVEQHSPGFEDNVAKLLSMGEAAGPWLDHIAEQIGGPDEILQVEEMVVQRDQMAAHVGAQQRLAKQLEADRADGERLQRRVKELFDLNRQFQPGDPELAETIAHHMQQAKASEIDADKRWHVQRVKEAEAEVERRASALAQASELFSNWMANHQGGESFEQAEEALVASLQMADARYEAAKGAETKTRAVQAQADERGIGKDSTNEAGKVVVTNGQSTYEVSPDGLGSILAQGYVPIREFVAQADDLVDYEGALDAQPSQYERAVEFATKWEAAQEQPDDTLSVQEAATQMSQAAKDAEASGKTIASGELAAMNDRLAAKTAPAPEPAAEPAAEGGETGEDA